MTPSPTSSAVPLAAMFVMRSTRSALSATRPNALKAQQNTDPELLASFNSIQDRG